ncbi:MAG: hypothetical protein FWE33_05420 [Defluviitaleaceae bacterium]|nr:hypothetical protein [Defluviitaleaceae bacterium]
MINKVSNMAVSQANYGKKQSYETKAKTAKQADQVQISNEAKQMQTGQCLREDLRQNGFNLRFAMLEIGGEDVQVIVTATGIWKPDGEGNHTLLDTSKGIAGVAQSSIHELEHLSLMLRHMPPDFVSTSVYNKRNNLVLDENIETITTQTQLTFKERLQQFVDVFEAMREDFNGNAQMQFSQTAFRLLLDGAIGLAAQLIRINLGEANINEETIEEIRLQSEEQLNIFASTFINNFNQHGKETAFNIAWATFGIEDTIK